MKSTLLKEKHYKEMESFCFGNRGISFLLLMEKDNKIKSYPRESQPCYGELRTYQPEEDGIKKPHDLMDPFPEGTPVGLSINLQFLRDHNIEMNDILKGLLDKENSPWRKLLGGLSLVKEGGKIVGWYTDDLHVESTALAQLLMITRRLVPKNNAYVRILEKTEDIKLTLFSLLNFVVEEHENVVYNRSPGLSYCFHPRTVPSRIFTGDFFSLSPGDGLLSSRSPYHRPTVSMPFSGNPMSKEATVPHREFLGGKKKVTIDQFVDDVIPKIRERYLNG